MLDLQFLGNYQFNFPVWGLSVLFAYVLVLILSLEKATRKGIHTEDIFKLANITILGGIIGGRIFYLYTQQYDIDWQTVFSWGEVFYSGDVSIIGGYLGALIVALIYIQSFSLIYNSKMSWLRFFDTFLYTIPIGMVFGYIGIFFSNIEEGIISNIAYPWLIQIGDNLVHPWALYVALGYLILFIILAVLNSRFYQFRKPGYLTLTFIIGVSIIHFITDFWHTYSLGVDLLKVGGLSITQIVTLITATLASIVILIKINLNQPKT